MRGFFANGGFYGVIDQGLIPFACCSGAFPENQQTSSSIQIVIRVLPLVSATAPRLAPEKS
jgi:hypothetical protein